jgi:hypothetical protein
LNYALHMNSSNMAKALLSAGRNLAMREGPICSKLLRSFPLDARTQLGAALCRDAIERDVDKFACMLREKSILELTRAGGEASGQASGIHGRRGRGRHPLEPRVPSRR